MRSRLDTVRVCPTQALTLSVADRTARITLTRPAKRNSLSEPVLNALLDALDTVAASSATGLVLAAEGPVFSAGHDFADVAARDVVGVLRLLDAVHRGDAADALDAARW